jgi:hypothetical protein
VAAKKSKKKAKSKTARAASTKPVGAKLALKPPMRVRVLGGPEERLGFLPAGVSPSDGSADAVVLFVENARALATRVEDAILALVGPRLLWVCYPKGGGGVATDLNRDALRKQMVPHGFRPVAQVAIDATWTAMRFKPV